VLYVSFETIKLLFIFIIKSPGKIKFTEEVVDLIKNYIILNISETPNTISQQTCDHFQITKPTVLKYINELAKANIIEK